MEPKKTDIRAMPTVADWAFRLQRREATSLGVGLAEARRIVARKVGLSPSTLDNLHRGRLKFVDRIKDKIFAALIEENQKEIRRLEHEIQMLRQMGMGSRDAEMVEVEACLSKARSLVEAMK